MPTPLEKEFVFRIHLRGSEPEIWREFAVRGDTTLRRLNNYIQEIMGWESCHLHEFRYKKTSYVPEWSGMADECWGNFVIEDDVRVGDLVRQKNQKLEYMYDFGDGWQHELRVVKTGPLKPDVSYPVCLDGAMACPLEDSGGLWGYYNILEALADPQHDMHNDYMEWTGGIHDPEHFSCAEVNAILEELKDADPT